MRRTIISSECSKIQKRNVSPKLKSVYFAYLAKYFFCCCLLFLSYHKIVTIFPIIQTFHEKLFTRNEIDAILSRFKALFCSSGYYIPKRCKSGCRLKQIISLRILPDYIHSMNNPFAVSCINPSNLHKLTGKK